MNNFNYLGRIIRKTYITKTILDYNRKIEEKKVKEKMI